MALDKEFSSLESTILTRIDPDDPEFEKAKELATPGRILLDIKRSGIYKARAVRTANPPTHPHTGPF